MISPISRSITLAGASPVFIDYPGNTSSGVPRPLRVQGTFNPAQCSNPKIKITYTVGSSIVVTGPTTPTIDGQFWDFMDSTTPAGATSAKIEFLCGTVVKATSNITFAAVAEVMTGTRSAADILDVTKDSSPPLFWLNIEINNPAAGTSLNDSYVVQVYKVISHGVYDVILHSFYPKPSEDMLIPNVFVTNPGRYLVKVFYFSDANSPELFSKPYVVFP